MQTGSQRCICTTVFISALFTIAKIWKGFPGGAVVKSLPADAGDAPGTSSIPGRRRSPGGGSGNPLQHSCLDKFMDRGAWWATVHGVALSGTRFQLSTHGIQNRYGNTVSIHQWMKGQKDIMCMCVYVYIYKVK